MIKVLPFSIKLGRPDLSVDKKSDNESVFKLTYEDSKKNRTIATMVVNKIIFPNDVKESPKSMENFLPTSPYYPLIIDSATSYMESFHQDPNDCLDIPVLVKITIV